MRLIRRWNHAWVALLGAGACAIGCKTLGGAESGKSHITDPQIRKAYQDLVALGDRARVSPVSGEAVLAYAGALVNAPGYLQANIERREWLARNADGAALVDAVLPGLQGAPRAGALDTQGILILASKGRAELPAVRSKFREAYKLAPAWRTGTLLLDVLDAAADGDEARQLCGACFEAGQKEAIGERMIVKLLDTCAPLTPRGQQPEQAMPSIPKETWRRYAAMAKVRAENRARQHEAELAEDAVRERERERARRAEEAKGPECLLDDYDHRYRLCTVRDTRGQCAQYGADCNPHAGSGGSPDCLFDQYSHRHRMCIGRDVGGNCAQYGADCNPG